MNFVLDNYHVDEKNISFLETKKNNIIDGNFTKIIYKDTCVTVNGIYLLFPVTVTGVDKSNGKTNVFFNPKIASNTSIINHISDIEGKIINCYKQEYNVSYKRNMSTLFNLLYNGKVKLYKEINYNPSHINLHSGLGCLRTPKAFKVDALRASDPGASKPKWGPPDSQHNESGFAHARESSLSMPRIEVNIVTFDIGFSSKILDIESRKRSSASPIEGWLLRSKVDGLSGPPTDPSRPPLEPPPSGEAVLGCKLRFSDQNPTKIVLKISGIWETANEIGITYKFLDMH